MVGVIIVLLIEFKDDIITNVFFLGHIFIFGYFLWYLLESLFEKLNYRKNLDVYDYKL